MKIIGFAIFLFLTYDYLQTTHKVVEHFINYGATNTQITVLISSLFGVGIMVHYVWNLLFIAKK